MSAQVETMAYANETPWHGLGHKVNQNLSVAKMLKAAELDWGVEKKAMTVGKLKVPDHYALVRDSDSSVLDVVGSRYKPVQNAEAFDFFKRFVEAGHMTMETAGSLCGGQYVWGLAKTGNKFDVRKDHLESYLLLMSPHKQGKALIVQHTSVRVVCWNTLNFALGSGLKGSEGSFRMPHVRAFDEDVKDSAEMALGLSKQFTNDMRDAVKSLAAKRLKDHDQYFCEVLRLDDAQREGHILKEVRQAYDHAPGAQLSTAKGTYWGGVNAITYVVDHRLGRNRDTALRSAWIGTKANMKRRALEVALAA